MNHLPFDDSQPDKASSESTVHSGENSRNASASCAGNKSVSSSSSSKPANVRASAELLMVDRRQAAAIAAVSVATWDRMNAAGKTPAPIHLSRGCVRWRLDDLRLWGHSRLPRASSLCSVKTRRNLVKSRSTFWFSLCNLNLERNSSWLVCFNQELHVTSILMDAGARKAHLTQGRLPRGPILGEVNTETIPEFFAP